VARTRVSLPRPRGGVTPIGASPPGPAVRRALQRYGAALAATGLAFAASLAARPIAGGSRPPVAFFLAAVAVSSQYGGSGPGLLATLIGVAAVDGFVEAVGRPPLLVSAHALLSVAAFAGVALLIGTLNGRLRAAVHERDAALAAMSDAERARDDLLARLTHDLKSPLTAIKGTAQAARRRVEAGRLAEVEIVPLLRQIESTAMGMAPAVDSLLDVRAAQPPISPRRIDLVALAEGIAARWGAAAPNHSIVTLASQPRIDGWWDAGSIERVVDNLVGNAVKYSPSGGDVRITIRAEADEAGRRVILAVQDWGIGIPPAELSRVFEPRYRASNAAARVGGSGIGLANVRDLVERHGGSVVAESAGPGRGSTIRVRLPTRAPA
jgi:signal transduction histidine kinase